MSSQGDGMRKSARRPGRPAPAVGAGREGGAPKGRVSGALRELIEAALASLRSDFWRFLETHVLRLVIFIMMLMALAELLGKHLATLYPPG